MIYDVLVTAEFALAVVTFVALMFVTAPYGRHMRSGWGPTLPSRLGWIVMEAPAVVVFAIVFAAGGATGAVPLALLALWQIHYVHRTFIFPFRTQSRKRMPWLIVASAIAFNTLNAGINAWWIGHVGDYSSAWFVDGRFLAGAALFVAGFAINVHSDHILIHLRKPGEEGYKIPRGGMYRFVSCPNYLGEMMEWVGWAIATWSLPGLAFALYTMANLVPRALQNHRWYVATFPDYPRRKAVLPGVL